MAVPIPHPCGAGRLLALATTAATLLGSLAALPGRAAGSIDTPGGKGAQVYCFMRNNDNSHAVSWSASYALIKRQGARVFKTSPEHAAVMITEAVVQNPGSFPDCGRFLGDLYAPRVVGSQSPSADSQGPTPLTVQGGDSAGGSGMTRSERYN